MSTQEEPLKIPDGFVKIINDFITDILITFPEYTNIINKWSHLIAVIENYNNVIKFFADGKLIGQRKMLLPIQSIKSSAGDIYLGQDAGSMIDPNGVSVYYFKGLIQSVSFYREKMQDARLIELSK